MSEQLKYILYAGEDPGGEGKGPTPPNQVDRNNYDV